NASWEATRQLNGRHRSHMVTKTGRRASIPAPRTGPDLFYGSQPASVHAPPFDRRLADVPSLDRHHRRACDVSGVLFDLSVDAEQSADALYRFGQFQLPAVARCVLDGGSAIRHFRAYRGLLQSADPPDYRASHQ